MSKVFSGSPVPRHTVFILADGSFVVQWDENRVQELLSGRYRSFDDHNFGHAITDYELNQLKVAGRVEHFNRQYVWLFALPETGRYDVNVRTLHRSHDRLRVYYLNTTLAPDQLSAVEERLQVARLTEYFLARVRGGVVTVLGRNGAPFRQLTDAERAQKRLVAEDPVLFRHMAVAFIETSNEDNGYKRQTEQVAEQMDLTAIIASQTDTSITAGKHAVVAAGQEDERVAIGTLLRDMGMEVRSASTGRAGLQCLEDQITHLLVMDIQMPDMHGWEMLAKIREIESLNDLAIVVVADHSAPSDEQTFALTVGRVDSYLARPVSMAQLRQNIWLTLKGRHK